MSVSIKAFRLILFVVVSLGIQLGHIPAGHADPGDLDSGFGVAGAATTDFFSKSDDRGLAMALQNDGKIVVAGTVRKGSSGSTGETYFPQIGRQLKSQLKSQRALPDGPKVFGKLKLKQRMTPKPAGPSSPPLSLLSTSDIALARYQADGSFDPSFGPDGTGKVIAATGNSDESVAGVFVLNDGKILVAGTTGNNAGSDLILLRYLPNGEVDTGFGPNNSGRVNVNFSPFEMAFTAALQPDGKVLLAGAIKNGGDSELALIRLQPDGTPDAGFGTNGLAKPVTLAGDSYAMSLALQNDGKILAGGMVSNGSDVTPVLVRCKPNGNPDTGFGPNADGKVLITGNNFIKGGITALGIQEESIQEPGGIVSAVGFPGGGPTFLLVRHTAAGIYDSGFGVNGLSEIAEPFGPTEVPYALRIQPDGKILAAGTSKKNTLGDSSPDMIQAIMDVGFALVRYLPNGHLDEGFGNHGVAPEPALGEGRGPHALILQGDGKILTAGTAGNGSGDDFAVVRYENE